VGVFAELAERSFQNFAFAPGFTSAPQGRKITAGEFPVSAAVRFSSGLLAFLQPAPPQFSRPDI